MVSISLTISAMDFRKLSFSDHQYLSSPRRKVVSPFGLGVILSFILFSALLFHISFKGPIFNPVFQGFNTFGSPSNGSFLSWPFSSSSNSNETLEANFTGSIKSLELVNSDEKSNVLERAHLGNVTDKFKNGSNFGKNSILVNGSMKNESSIEAHENGDLRVSVKNMSYKDCDIYNGRWVRDETKPNYPSGSCPYIEGDFNCHLNGRPDNEFVKWKWQPYDCDIPRLNTTDFLERLRGQKLVFIGDSLNRNMWESLVCVLRHGVKHKSRVYEISGKHKFKKKGFYAFRFEDYNCSIDFVSSPFLVKESSFKGKSGSFETLRLDLMDGTTSMYHDADVLIFNTGHWWTHEKTSRGENYYQEGNYIHPRLKVLEAFKRALATWARWVDKNIDKNKAHVIFRGYSVTHFRGGPWNSGGQCNKETEPIFNDTYLAKYPSKMKLLEYTQGHENPRYISKHKPSNGL